MAKKDKTVREVPQALLQGITGKEDRLMNDYNGMRRMLMSAMAAMGVTPEEYASFLGNDKSFDEHRDQFLSMAEDLGISETYRLRCCSDSPTFWTTVSVKYRNVFTGPPRNMTINPRTI